MKCKNFLLCNNFRADKESEIIKNELFLDLATMSRANKIPCNSAVNIEHPSSNLFWITCLKFGPETAAEATLFPDLKPSVKILIKF